ncbi:MAG: hypothetical protein PHC64_08705 [Candidatus Gastranaerophilales bacterium]|nr:hypothetical protein [Candidatus Gastranaerophilales bacterium]
MTKIKDSVWGIFTQSVKLYFTNFGSFLKYMSFPVFGQILGIILILSASYFYAAALPNIIIQGGIFDNFLLIFLILLLVTLPGFIIFIKAFWDYLVAFGAVNSMVDNLLKSGRVYDFHAHTEVITRRSGSFALLWLLLAVMGLIGGNPLFWVISGILFVYFILVFQVFTFEPDKSPWGCFVKSAQIIKGNFARTLGLIILVGVLSYKILPDIVEFIFDFLNILTFLSIPLDGWAQQLPIDEINKLLLQTPMAYQLTSLLIAKFIVSFFLSYIVTCLTLPMRSICWALWYKNLNKGEKKLDKRILERAEAKD